MTEDCRGWDLNIQPSACEAKALADCATTAVFFYVKHCKTLLNLNDQFVNVNCHMIKTVVYYLVLRSEINCSFS